MAEKRGLYVLCENQREVDACIDYKIQNNHKWASGNPVSVATDSGYKSGYVINMADGGNTTIYDKADKKAEVIKFSKSQFANWTPQVNVKHNEGYVYKRNDLDNTPCDEAYEIKSNSTINSN